MKIIDLLNMISKGEEVPKYIQYYNMLKDKTDIMMVCKENIFYKLDQLEIQLNSRVEILEEERKIPEKLEEYIHTDSLNYNQCNYMFEKLTNKYNEIIDYLKSKGE